ncbi:hypothetical protein FisN_13Hu083 [Fistulifera solaris]|uniref:Uncharacterized protein n=1 Tax=Fistulifera solaris TaxID=1519565 RepID=A0A1Z5KN98_FISSO|nr:hypothetical protein FisN_13Hu083 [Fistulifera solaris]|eukprot:GAX27810.1 hypothetical protein FisN_13Hu083 [Fistulifera solaris]
MLFRRVRARCMKRILRTPLRVIEFRNLTLSALQCSLLATRPHPLHVTFQDCEFEGCGWAFVEALEKRTSSFGSLTFKGHIDLASDELERLFQVNCIEHLNLPCLDYNGKVSILPLAAPVDHLKYDLYADPDIMEGIFQSLNIVAKKLDVVIRNSGLDFPTEYAGLPDCVLQEMISAVMANCSLNVLDLSTKYNKDLQWDSHIGALFKSVADHTGLKSVKVNVYNEAFGPDFYHLRELLSHNRQIVVTDENGNLYSDGYLIDRLYFLNRLYQGSTDLLVDPSSERSSLVAIALLQSAMYDFPCTGLLLSHHTDVLCELFQCAPLSDIIESVSPSDSLWVNDQKRRRRL